MPKLTDEVKQKIVELDAEGKTFREIAKELKVSIGTISKVLRGEEYTGVPGEIQDLIKQAKNREAIALALEKIDRADKKIKKFTNGETEEEFLLDTINILFDKVRNLRQRVYQLERAMQRITYALNIPL